MDLRKLSKGQSAVELALGIPLMALLLLVAADFARAFNMAIRVASAARAGVQYGAQSYTKAVDNVGMSTAATNGAPNVSGLSIVPTHFCICDGSQCNPSQTSACTVSCTAPPSSCSQPKIIVQVTASATFSTLINYPGIPASIPLSSTAVLQAQSGQGL